MDWRRSDDSAARFSAYLQEIAGVMEHAARVAPMRAYCKRPSTTAACPGLSKELAARRLVS